MLKRFFSLLVLLGALALVGCSSSSDGDSFCAPNATVECEVGAHRGASACGSDNIGTQVCNEAGDGFKAE